jgi:hypothetical protein
MARGWESKSVEEQQSQATAGPSPIKAQLTPEQIAIRHKRDGLLLSRKRVQQQIEAAQNPAHRKMLEDSLAELNARLARLG